MNDGRLLERVVARPPSYLRDHGRLVAVLAGLAVLVRLPFLTMPAYNDEGGLLMVAAQWQPGHSLYGRYWVDRPPLLVDVFGVADRFGGLVGAVVALRLLGLLFVAASVLLAGLVAHLAHGPAADPRDRRRGVVGAAGVAAVLLSQPWLGTSEVNAELVATPVVLAGIALVLAGSRAATRRRQGLLLAAAGAAAAAALLIKQNEADVAVALGVAALTVLRRGLLSSTRSLAAAAAGAVTLGVAVVAQAESRGTEPGALWKALVVFRFHASRVIAESASPTTAGRLHELLWYLVLSGIPVLLITAAHRFPTHPRAGALDLRWLVAALLAWETFSVLGGGSYWAHYLICLVPGTVLAETVRSTIPAPNRHPPAWLRWPGPAFAWLVVALGVALAQAVAALPGHQNPVVAFVRTRAHRQDTAVVAFGHPDYLQALGIRSPYPELWSLPVRVRDPELRHLTAVLQSSRRPDWIITGADSDLAGWGISDQAAEVALHSHYREVGYVGGHAVFLLRSESRPPRS